jgi:DNA-dependent RNA polymerase auxiliary subunit epsilon
MKRALTQAFTKVDENLVCEFHTTFKNQLLSYEKERTHYTRRHSIGV